MEQKWKLMTKPGCHNCEILKKQIQDNKLNDDIIVMNVSTPEGMAQAAYYETLEKPVPYIIFDDGRDVQIIDEMKTLESIILTVTNVKEVK